jgi:prepilin-type N-terminal cleavage/methylation domain-containing protein
MRIRARKGFTLLEAVLAIAIVAMTAVAALSAVGTELRTAEHARRIHEAEALATEKAAFMWLLVDKDFQSLPDSVSKGVFDYPLNEYSWTATSTANSTLPGLYSIEINVFWQGGSYTETTAQYRRPVVSTGAR